MPNMSYCIFENTFHDLEDCWENIDPDDTGTRSESEEKYRRKLIELCCDIAVDFGFEIDRIINEE